MEVNQLKQHPAAEWASKQRFDTIAVDCTTTVVLKILDGKCKMLPGEKNAILEIYDVVKHQTGEIFNKQTHQAIDVARAVYDQNTNLGDHIMQHIHELRVFAESQIPKPTMKTYKAMLREGLFG